MVQIAVNSKTINSCKQPNMVSEVKMAEIDLLFGSLAFQNGMWVMSLGQHYY